MYSWCSMAVLSSISSSAKVLSTPRSARKSIRWSYRAWETVQESKQPWTQRRFQWLLYLNRCCVYCLDSHPVQRVCVEVVARLLPLWISLWLKTDLSNGKDVALLFSLTVTHLQNTNLSLLSTALLLLAILHIHFIWLYLIFREMAVEHQGMFGSLLCHFNNKVGCWYNLRLQKGGKKLNTWNVKVKNVSV